MHHGLSIAPEWARAPEGNGSRRAEGDATETNKIHWVLFGMQNRTFGPYLAADNRILISLVRGVRTCAAVFHLPQTLTATAREASPPNVAAHSRSADIVISRPMMTAGPGARHVMAGPCN
jgi:hypothetical protein